MSDQTPHDNSLEGEFEKLGKNIRDALHGAWSSEERQQLSQEIERGLNNLGNALGKAAEELQQNETIQKVSAEVDEFAEQVRSGDVAQKLRQGTLEVLETLNLEIEGWINRWSASSEESDVQE